MLNLSNQSVRVPSPHDEGCDKRKGSVDDLGRVEKRSDVAYPKTIE